MIFDDATSKEIRKQLSALADNVKLVVFTQKMECQYCKESREMAEELAGLSDKLSIEVFDFQENEDKVKEYGIDKIPAIAIVGKKDFGIRFYGIPAGYEFASLIEAVKLVSTGNAKISEKTKEFLKTLDKDVHLQVFVTPTCPYCPQAVVIAHKLAYSSDRIKADMVEISEFPHLAVKYSVQGVPRTVINENVFQVGAAPEPMILEKIKQALG